MIKSTASYKMSQKVKRVSALFLDNQSRGEFLRQMADAERTYVAMQQRTKVKKSSTEAEEE